MEDLNEKFNKQEEEFAKERLRNVIIDENR